MNKLDRKHVLPRGTRIGRKLVALLFGVLGAAIVSACTPEAVGGIAPPPSEVDVAQLVSKPVRNETSSTAA